MGQSISNIVHDFQERLEFSQSLSNEDEWVAFYRRVWPDVISIVRMDADSRFQRIGIDRIIFLPNGKQIWIDEKNRDPQQKYRDILLEEWSVWRGEGHPTNKVGWALDPSKQCDYIVYALHWCGEAYLLPCELLRLALQANFADWKTRNTNGRRWYPFDSQNRGYVTRNIGVPWPDLKRGINEQMYRRNGERLILPRAHTIDNQLLFEWGGVTPHA